MGKYKNLSFYLIAKVYRTLIRFLIAPLVTWKSQSRLEDGCTAIIGLCSKLPRVLPANLRGLQLAKWPELKEVIIVVDRPRDGFFVSFEEEMSRKFKDLNIRFLYYGPAQKIITNILQLPYVNAWLSWSIAINETKTASFLIQDYDALLLGNVLADRYREFKKTKSVVYGIAWYGANGIVRDDKLVATFEAFVDTAWVKARKPIEIFNRIGLYNGRRVDFDSFIYLQANYSEISQRHVMAMSEEELVHPSQMICQYTTYQKFPGRAWDCSALIMIPFFNYVSGQKDAFQKALQNMRQRDGTKIELLDDRCLMNFERLIARDLDRILQMMVQGFIKLGQAPFEDFFQYANAFYDLVALPVDKRWGFVKTDKQKQWVKNC